jgi:hypothetical protein
MPVPPSGRLSIWGGTAETLSHCRRGSLPLASPLELGALPGRPILIQGPPTSAMGGSKETIYGQPLARPCRQHRVDAETTRTSARRRRSRGLS